MASFPLEKGRFSKGVMFYENKQGEKNVHCLCKKICVRFFTHKDFPFFFCTFAPENHNNLIRHKEWVAFSEQSLRLNA